MAKSYNEPKKPILFTICLTQREVDEQIKLLRNRSAANINVKAQRPFILTACKRYETPLKTKTVELPPISKGAKIEPVCCTTPVTVQWEEFESGKIGAQKNGSCSHFPASPKKELPKKSIRQVKPQPLKSLINRISKTKEQDKVDNFICLGVQMKTRVQDTNIFDRKTHPFSTPESKDTKRSDSVSEKTKSTVPTCSRDMMSKPKQLVINGSDCSSCCSSSNLKPHRVSIKHVKEPPVCEQNTNGDTGSLLPLIK